MGFSSPWPVPSTPGRTRSNATGWPSVSSAYRGAEERADMEFAFDENQLEFRHQLHAFAEKQCTPTDVRAAWASELGWSPERGHALADMGVVGVTVPDADGGLGLEMVDLVLLLEEAGRAGLPEPLLETTCLAVPLLASATGAGAEQCRQQWLSKIAAGDAVCTVGMADMSYVSVATGADLFLLEHGGEIHAVPAESVTLAARASIDGARRLAEVSWEPSPATRLSSAHEAVVALAACRQRAAMGTGAMLLGITDRLISMAGEYAKARTQFGKPIGSFQAVKHLLADALVRLEFARPAVYRAAWSLSVHDKDAALHASMAKAMASDAATAAARTALQVHGAIGYTWEHDLHLWMKPAWALAAAWGDARWHRARVLDELGGPDTGGG